MENCKPRILLGGFVIPTLIEIEEGLDCLNETWVLTPEALICSDVFGVIDHGEWNFWTSLSEDFGVI
jgi:hypothetical protein